MKNTKTKMLTAASMLCALSVVLMLAGSIIDVMDLSVAAICSFIIAIAAIELGGAYPLLIFSVSSVLGMLLLPNKLPALYYLLFFGWYPIAKKPLDRLNKPLGFTLKMLLCSLSLTLILLASALVAPAEELVKISVWVYAVCLPVFILYDAAFERVTLAYLMRWRHRLHLWK